MSAKATRSGRAGPEPIPDAGRSPAIDRPVRHAPQPTRRRPRSTPPARKDENPSEAIRHPARNEPPREPKMHDGRLRQSTRHRSAEAITVSGLTPELSRAAKRRRLERIVRQQLAPLHGLKLAVTGIPHSAVARVTTTRQRSDPVGWPPCK